MHSYPFENTDLQFNDNYSKVKVINMETGRPRSGSPHNIPNGTGNVGLEIKKVNGEIIITPNMSFGEPEHTPRTHIDLDEIPNETVYLKETAGGGGTGTVIGIGDVRFRNGTTNNGPFDYNYGNHPVILVNDNETLKIYFMEP